jgi:hypothetical protein
MLFEPPLAVGLVLLDLLPLLVTRPCRRTPGP